MPKSSEKISATFCENQREAQTENCCQSISTFNKQNHQKRKTIAKIISENQRNFLRKSAGNPNGELHLKYKHSQQAKASEAKNICQNHQKKSAQPSAKISGKPKRRITAKV